MRIGDPIIQADCPVESFYRAFRIFFAQSSSAKITPGVFVRRIQCEDFIIARAGFSRSPGSAECITEIEMRSSIFRRQFDRDLSGFDCRLEMGSIRIGSAKVCVGRRKSAALYRALEIDQCQIVFTAFTQDDSNVAQCFGIVRLQRDGVLEGIECLARCSASRKAFPR